MTLFQPGDRVFWWRRISRAIDFPYRARILAVTAKRITIQVEHPVAGGQAFVRHVEAKSLQTIAAYFEKAYGHDCAILQPAATWGRSTIFLEIGEDLRPVRQVEVFDNGKQLSYDRTHWVDDFGTLGDAQIRRSQKQGCWGECEEIDAVEFERVWTAARESPTWHEQVSTAQMAKRGAIPIWLTITGWYPE